MTPPLRVLFVCTGVGIMNRGIETFFREAFDGLHGCAGLSLRLLKGAGQDAPDERVLWSLPRTGWCAKVLGVIARRNGYVVEQWSSLPSVLRQIREFRPNVVFYSDANLGFLLFRLRKWLRVPFRLLFSNGGPVRPPFHRTDFVHQVAPVYHEEAMGAREPGSRQCMIPYGIRVIPKPVRDFQRERDAARQRLGFPPGCPIVLSVGWVQKEHKRMDYVIQEVARLPQPRPFLQLLGAIDDGSMEILEFGKRVLGKDRFAANSVEYEKVFEYYRAADCFVLASLQEGFGRVYLEALMHGLPVIAHRSPVTEYVLRRHGILADLRKPGELSRLLSLQLQRSPDPFRIRSRWQSVRDRFSWDVLSPEYREMFNACSRTTALRTGK